MRNCRRSQGGSNGSGKNGEIVESVANGFVERFIHVGVVRLVRFQSRRVVWVCSVSIGVGGAAEVLKFR